MAVIRAVGATAPIGQAIRAAVATPAVAIPVDGIPADATPTDTTLAAVIPAVAIPVGATPADADLIAVRAIGRVTTGREVALRQTVILPTPAVVRVAAAVATVAVN